MGNFKHPQQAGSYKHSQQAGSYKHLQQAGGYKHLQQAREMWSTVQCFNCGGSGHMKRDCSSISRIGASKISRKSNGGQEGQQKRQNVEIGAKKGKVVDKEGFELVERNKGKRDIRIAERVEE
ncbi:hypothetical protein L211DRAFT_197170 [Terfezia boudieri ATCC MYA-4762]|uniref:CCHC-type domain-containing protein n=1 Tax=Terfezia boudieri ATCC MYA-4762 TaxID=1051890 RepID=A0A3N4LRS3_9PEZI|nr:hypothetical protein L211DRAFT_197170 [Terfezia boudieri ATCC MYA-4762]